MAVQTATTKTYSVPYIKLDTVAAVADLVTSLLPQHIEVGLRSWRDDTETDHHQVTLTNPGNSNRIVAEVGTGRYIFWDRGIMYDLDLAEAQNRYTNIT